MSKLLTFAEANPAACIRLASGHEVMLDQLMQSQTYAGLLMGLPNASTDGRILDAAHDEARKLFGDLTEPCLIQPDKLSYVIKVQQRKVNSKGRAVEAGEVEERKGERLPLV